MEYRNLTNEEILQLEQQMCTCDEWSNIFVSSNFKPTSIYNSHFSGVVKIGSQTDKIKLYGGIKRQSGIYNATIHNCGIGNNCYINFVKNHISNYNIGDNVVINNVELIANEGESSFGNGSRISVLDESGGRQIMIYDGLSAQIAYIMTLYRHRPNLIKKLEEIIGDYAREISYSRGTIANDCTISNTGSIKNMRIGSHVTIDGCKMLQNGTIVSNEFAPVFIGNNVIIKDTIILSGTEIKEGVILIHCFIGQGCQLGKNYSAENSVFFANCQGFHGEACSIFAGPFTVTHHKSTLLIAGMYSFLNAGSGSNQSNHMYKLGPIHQGIVERGSKTTSDSYLLWPAKIGPFTLVMGRHYKNSDTSNMPFSYLIERDDKTWLAPAVNLRSVGTIRDAMKWPKRDNRKDPNKIDCINFNLLSPFTIQKMVKAISILNNLKEVSGEGSSEYIFNNTSISSTALHRGIQLYYIGIDKFLGNSIITRLKEFEYQSIEDLRKRLKPNTDVGNGDWLDLSGLIAPKNEVVKILDEIENGTISDLKEIQNRFVALHRSYYDIEWTWSAWLLEWRLGKKIDEITGYDILAVIEQWKKSVVDLDKMLYNDAKKEFQLSSMTGFGADGDKKTQQADFEMVRGTFENNSLVQEIQSHIQRKSELGDRMIAKIKQCCGAENQ
jgi:carbonic anhydrase/acetyltransferase-like protein (isoleucine patch superfamily)